VGLIARSSRSHHGSEDQRAYRGRSPLVMPIFGTNFTGHGIPNWTYHGGPVPSKKSMPSAPGRPSFAGESREGWGYHPDGTVDCLNTRLTLRWTLGSDADTWENLWNMEGRAQEFSAKAPNGVKAFLQRLVVTVHLITSGVLFIPDPSEWCVYIPNEPIPSPGLRGYLIPRPATDPGGAAVRSRLARKRALTLQTCAADSKNV